MVESRVQSSAVFSRKRSAPILKAPFLLCVEAWAEKARERKRESKRESERERKKESKRKREREQERERESKRESGCRGQKETEMCSVSGVNTQSVLPT